MSWKPEIDQIAERKRLARELGGKDAVRKQHSRGRLTIRERIERITDPGSFREEGPQAGHAERDEDGRLVSFQPANYVVGFATIADRPCVVGGEDFTQRGGSPSPAGLRKSVYSEQMALRYRLPLVRFLEGGGGSVTGSGGKGGRHLRCLIPSTRRLVSSRLRACSKRLRWPRQRLARSPAFRRRDWWRRTLRS